MCLATIGKKFTSVECVYFSFEFFVVSYALSSVTFICCKCESVIMKLITDMTLHDFLNFFNLYHMAIGDLNPCTVELPTRF
jgi:hypothetical protein